MSDAQALADRIVALGILDGGNGQYYPHHGINERWLSADEFIRDGRVVLALMEKMGDQETLIWAQHYEEADSVWIVELGNSPSLAPSDGRDESLAIAIVTATLEALETNSEG